MRYLTYWLSLLLLLGIVTTANGQDEKQAKILLKNGLKIKGAIVRSFDDKSLEIDIYGSEPVLIRFDHIKRISFRDYGSITNDFENNLNVQPGLQTKSFFHEIRGGLLFGEENVSGTIHTINGYQFNRYLGTGLGLGVNKYGNYITMPIYASVKGFLFDKVISPFYFGDIGYGFAWKTNKNDNVFELDNVQGGYYWQLGLGYQFNFYNSSLVLALGYSNQDSKADYIYYRPWDIDDVEVSERRILRRFALTVGFLF